ncbi:Ribosomal RNA small subunit methyltransferase B [invertebrate metagenome]|uniref:16S rRNA (cytosine(967)-C(5))-methyltransferase n=1 Tax=invertebrate metagenome TaxID=1711999 RepID=A0A2H9T853_9ZZZZ
MTALISGTLRLSAARVVAGVLNGMSLSSALPQQQAHVPAKDQGLLAELSYGTLRYFHRLDIWLKHLMQKPIKPREQEVKAILLVGLYQLFYTRIPAHAAINETVQAVKLLKKNWAQGLVNGVLRNAQRQSQELQALADNNETCASSHPLWLQKALRQAWPDHWRDILQANNQLPPMTLRVNVRHYSRAQYQQRLQAEGIESCVSVSAPDALILKQPVVVEKLPEFAQGVVSVQDESAQLAGMLLPVKSGDRVLDACCAPGGKTCHILECHDTIAIDALDCDAKRLERVRENLGRLQLDAHVLCGDASDPDSWWDGQPYDAVLLDAPCSATGVIRRHPDIKLLRKARDIAALVQLQADILKAIWKTVKPGGVLLYATCSVMPEENQQQIAGFVQSHTDARILDITVTEGFNTGFGLQRFPGAGDGFFYSLLNKAVD